MLTHVFGALQCGPFWTIGGVGHSAQTFWSNAWLPTGQIWADQIFFDHFEFKMQNKLGSFLCKKMIRAKMGMVSFGRRPTAIGRIFFIKYFNFDHILYKIQIERGVSFFEKNMPTHVFEAPFCRLF